MVYNFKTTITVSAGSGAANTLDIGKGGECSLFHVAPTTATTIYKINITDADGIIIYDPVKFFKGTRRIIDKIADAVTMYGICTINITDSSVNEDFVVKMLIKET